MAGYSNGTGGSGASALIQPVGVVVDSSANVYVAEYGNARAQFWGNGASSGTTIAGVTGRNQRNVEIVSATDLFPWKRC